MEFMVYVLAAAAALAWSVWSYLFWEKQKELPGEGLLRSWFMVAPSFWYIAVASSGWSDFFLRLDLMGLVLLTVVHVLAGVALGLLAFFKKHAKRNYFWVMGSYSALALVLTLFLHLARNVPVLSVQLAVFNSYLQDPNSLFYHLLAVGTGGEGTEVATVFDKLLIAILSIVPFALFRMILLNIRLAKLNKRMESLETRLAQVEGQPAAEAGKEIHKNADTV